MIITKNVFDTETNTELTVNEYTTQAEFVKECRDWIDSIKLCEHLKHEPYIYIYIQYKNGDSYSRSYMDENGKFKPTGIKTAIVDDGFEYYIFGDYVMNAETNFIPTTV